ncbi:hypothetical protein RRG08_062820, partial [Elysia crispata]
PYYLPREFPNVDITSLYIPPSANAQDAAEQLGHHVNNPETAPPDTLKTVAGDLKQMQREQTSDGIRPTGQLCTRGYTTFDFTVLLYKRVVHKQGDSSHLEDQTTTWCVFSQTVDLWSNGSPQF